MEFISGRDSTGGDPKYGRILSPASFSAGRRSVTAVSIFVIGRRQSVRSRGPARPIFFNPFCLQYRPPGLRLSFRFSEPVNPPTRPRCFLFRENKTKNWREKKKDSDRERKSAPERFFGHNEADLHRLNFYLDLFRHWHGVISFCSCTPRDYRTMRWLVISSTFSRARFSSKYVAARSSLLFTDERVVLTLSLISKYSSTLRCSR